MLELKPICENCQKYLPNESKDAMICSFECTFCKDCVANILENVCPNCGGGFEKRPSRPKNLLSKLLYFILIIKFIIFLYIYIIYKLFPIDVY